MTYDDMRSYLAGVRAEGEAMLEQVDAGTPPDQIDHLAEGFARVRIAEEYVDRWAERGDELAEALDRADPIVREYIEDTFKLIFRKGTP